MCLCVCLDVNVWPFSIPLLCAALNMCEHSIRVEGSYLKVAEGRFSPFSCAQAENLWVQVCSVLQSRPTLVTGVVWFRLVSPGEA